MYHDSDDEPLSGDDEEVQQRRVVSHRKTVGTKRKQPPPSPPNDTGGKRSAVARRGHGEASRRRKTGGFDGFNIYPVIVVDYDLTLVDRSSRPFPGSHDFIEKLREFNDGRNQLILYSHGSPAYIDEGLSKHYERERKYFDEIISDSSARDNKPITYVRRVIKKVDHLIGPYIIIDDMRSNLDGDQYDVVIDITRMTDYGQDGRAVSVDYDSCLCVVEQGVQSFLKTKRKSAK